MLCDWNGLHENRYANPRYNNSKVGLDLFAKENLWRKKFGS